jgi:hypothetical protein
VFVTLSKQLLQAELSADMTGDRVPAGAKTVGLSHDAVAFLLRRGTEPRIASTAVNFYMGIGQGQESCLLSILDEPSIHRLSTIFYTTCCATFKKKSLYVVILSLPF